MEPIIFQVLVVELFHSIIRSQVKAAHRQIWI